MVYLSVKFDDIHLGGFTVIAKTGIDILPSIVTLTLGVATYILHATHLLIMLYLSPMFHQICFSSFWPGLGLPSQRPMLSYQKKQPLPKYLRKQNE